MDLLRTDRKETIKMSRVDGMLVACLAKNQTSRVDRMLVETRIIETTRPVRDEMLVACLAKNQMSRGDRMLVKTQIIEATRPVRDGMLVENNTVACTLRELPAMFHAIGNASRETFGGDYHSTDILSLWDKRHCEERSDEAIQICVFCSSGLTSLISAALRLLRANALAMTNKATRPVRDEMLAENNTVACTLRELPAVFHAIGNASRETLGGDYVSTDILSLTGQASPTCGKETIKMSRRDGMLVENRIRFSGIAANATETSIWNCNIAANATDPSAVFAEHSENVATDILYLTGQTSPTCGKETIKMNIILNTKHITSIKKNYDEKINYSCHMPDDRYGNICTTGIMGRTEHCFSRNKCRQHSNIPLECTSSDED
ncbi:MAG: hypothetical protein LBF01_01060 [Bacteroidales bacterium]|jgi:enoyl-[acyl-carrier-protein] reductase (NADH)|nr:hypothetical protein [Bacteroidales bacterium]